MAGIALYVARVNTIAALNLIDRIEERCVELNAYREVGDRMEHIGKGVRATAVGRYVIYFRCNASQVEILRMIAGDQDVQSL